jgi:hypothetical protein
MTASDKRSCLSVLERKDLTVTDALLPANIFKPSGLKTIFEYIQMCLRAMNLLAFLYSTCRLHS